VANFMSTANVEDLRCIGNAILVDNNHDACPAAVTANTYSADDQLEGPVPAGGGIVTNLKATTNTAPGAGQSYLVEVMNNTTGATLISCTVTTGNTSCQDTSTTSIAAGEYLQVRIDNQGGASNRMWRVSFRY
jgi:hypothetical protein